MDFKSDVYFPHVRSKCIYASFHSLSCRLTSFVLKSFAQASDHIYIDTEVMKKAVLYIISQQNQDGSFNNTGKVYSKSLQVSKSVLPGCHGDSGIYFVSRLCQIMETVFLENMTLFKLMN